MRLAKGLAIGAARALERVPIAVNPTAPPESVPQRLIAQERLWRHGSPRPVQPTGAGFATRRQARDETVDWLRSYGHRRLRSTLAFERKGLGDKERLAA